MPEIAEQLEVKIKPADDACHATRLSVFGSFNNVVVDFVNCDEFDGLHVVLDR